MYMKYDSCLSSSYANAILLVFAELFYKESKETRNLPLCGRLKYYLVRIFCGSTARLGE